MTHLIHLGGLFLMIEGYCSMIDILNDRRFMMQLSRFLRIMLGLVLLFI
jgi:uncharacterized membrane protein HdeD (DUF308 family)